MAALLLASTVSVRDVAAADPSATTEPAAAPTPPTRHSYAGLLTATYVVAPLLAVAVGGGISQLTKRDEISVSGGCLMSLLPASVHVAHGNAGQGLGSFFGLVGVTFGSLVVGALVGGLISSQTCTSDSSDGCDFAALNGVIAGSLIGGVAGYVGFAIYDVSANASHVSEPPAAAALSPRLWLNPLPAPAEQGAMTAGSAHAPWTGLQLGLTVQM